MMVLNSIEGKILRRVWEATAVGKVLQNIILLKLRKNCIHMYLISIK